MSFLDGMFGGLEVATKVVTADTTVVLGWLYRVRAPGDVTLSLTPAPLAQASGQRLAAKVVEAGAGVVTVAVPAGMLIEADDGTRALTATLEQALGNYREWLCDPNGNWLLVTPPTAAGGGGTADPHAASHEDGGADELSVEGLSGVLASAQVADVLNAAETRLSIGVIADGQLLGRVGPTIVGVTRSVEGVTGVCADPQRANTLVVSGPAASLVLGSVPDGQYLKRVGATVVGAAVGAAPVTYRSTAAFAVGGSAAIITGIPGIAMVAGQYYRVVCAGMVMATGANAAFHMFPSPVTGAQNSYASATENSRAGYMSATETNPSGGASATAENSMSQHTMSTSGGDADYLSAKLPTASKRYLVRIEMNFKLQTSDTVELRVSSAGAIPMTVDKGFAVTVTVG